MLLRLVDEYRPRLIAVCKSALNPFPHMPILVSFSSAANKDMMS